MSQDDPGFPAGLDAVDDRALELSYRLAIDFVPTLLRLAGGEAQERLVGWNREEWETLSGVQGLGPELPSWRPGCSSPQVIT